MQVEQSGSLNKPMVINDHFFSHLEPLIDAFRERGLREIAARHKISVTKIERICADQGKTEPRLNHGINTIEGLQEERRKLEQWERNRRVIDDVERELSVTCSVKYGSGFSSQTNDLEQLKSVLRSEPGDIDRLHLSVGQDYRRCGFRLRFSHSGPPAAFDINGERREEVDHLYQAMMRFLPSISPPHAWLHDRNLHGFLGMLVAGTVGVSLFILVDSLRVPIPKNAALAIAVSTLLMITLISIIAAGAMIILLSRLFPRLECEMGPSSKTRTGYRTLLFGLLTVVAIPVIVNLLI